MAAALTFRVLLAGQGPSSEPIRSATEGPALAVALDLLDKHRESGGRVDDYPAKNWHGSRRWQLRDRAGEIVGALYIEPDQDAAVFAREWLAAGYPTRPGWWADTPAGLTRTR